MITLDFQIMASFGPVKKMDLIIFIKHDKKNSDDKAMFVLLENLGKPLIDQSVTDMEIEDAFKLP